VPKVLQQELPPISSRYYLQQAVFPPFLNLKPFVDPCQHFSPFFLPSGPNGHGCPCSRSRELSGCVFFVLIRYIPSSSLPRPNTAVWDFPRFSLFTFGHLHSLTSSINSPVRFQHPPPSHSISRACPISGFFFQTFKWPWVFGREA